MLGCPRDLPRAAHSKQIVHRSALLRRLSGKRALRSEPSHRPEPRPHRPGCSKGRCHRKVLQLWRSSPRQRCSLSARPRSAVPVSPHRIRSVQRLRHAELHHCGPQRRLPRLRAPGHLAGARVRRAPCRCRVPVVGPARCGRQWRRTPHEASDRCKCPLRQPRRKRPERLRPAPPRRGSLRLGRR